jgi:hypothetical protein
VSNRATTHGVSTEWLTAQGRRSLRIAAIVAVVACAAAYAGQASIAKRIAVALPVDGARDFARELIRNVALAGLVGSALLALGVRWFTVRRETLALWVIAVSVCVYAGIAAAWWGYINDDAGITFTYARNLAEGHGLVYNVGDAPVEGYSNPVWLLLLAAAHAAGLEIMTVAKALGLISGVACVLVLGHALRNERPWVWLALPLTVTNAAFLIWTNSGLENGLHTLLLTSLIFLLPGAASVRRLKVGLVVVLSLLVLSRPEGVVFALVAAGYVALSEPRRLLGMRRAMQIALVPLVVFGGLILFRWVYFGDVLPNTFYAKADRSNPLRLLNPFSGGWLYVGGALAGGAWTLGLVPALLALRDRERRPLVLATLAVIAGQLLFVVPVGGDWMGEFRFMSVIVPAIALLVAIGLDETHRLLAAAAVPRRWVVLACAIPAAIIAMSQVPRLLVFAAQPTTSLEAVARIGQHFVDLARRAGIANPTLLHHDAGGTAYIARIHTIDLGGLCDRTIAKHWRERETIRRYIFEEQRPTFIYSASVFAKKIGLEDFPEFERDYVPLPPAPEPSLAGDIRRVRRECARSLIVNESAP